MIAQGDVWWANLDLPVGSAPGKRRPVVVVQSDSFNRSGISTVVCVPMTGNVRWAEAPGNVQLEIQATGLGKDSVANVSQILTVDRATLTEKVGTLPDVKLDLVLRGIDVVLER